MFRPFIPNGIKEPAFPFIVMCYNVQEAREVFELQPFVEQLDMTQSVDKLAMVVASSDQIQGTLKSVCTFYPVAYGIRETGIYRDWCVI
jgi:hypothetical protein